MDQLFSNRDVLRWRLWRAGLELHRANSRHGLRANHLPRESARHRGLLAGQPEETVWHGFRHPVKRATLADANEGRDWHIWEDLAMVLIRRARKLYCDESFGIDLANTVYALDATTIDLCLSLFPWAPFRSSKAAVKMHTLLDLRGNIPAFIHISDGKMGDVNVLDTLPIEASILGISISDLALHKTRYCISG